MPRILVTMSKASYHRVIAPLGEHRLEELGDLDILLDPFAQPVSELQQHWTACDYALTGWGVRPPSAEWFTGSPRLRAICHSAGSVRMFPRELLERGVVITSARSAIARSVAEFCLLCCLSLLRSLSSYDSRTASAMATLEGPARPDTQTLFGKTVLLIGLGHVGHHFRELLRPFKVRVLVSDPYLSPEQAQAWDVELTSLQDGLPQADVVSVHAPDIPETRGMFGRSELEMIRPGAVFINTARGRLVDTQALTELLRQGRFRAALDVTDPEPLPEDHPLRSLPNCLLTPHVAGPTTDELPQLGETAVSDLERILRGEPPLWPITLDDYDRMSY